MKQYLFVLQTYPGKDRLLILHSNIVFRIYVKIIIKILFNISAINFSATIPA